MARLPAVDPDDESDDNGEGAVAKRKLKWTELSWPLRLLQAAVLAMTPILFLAGGPRTTAQIVVIGVVLVVAWGVILWRLSVETRAVMERESRRDP